MYELKKMFKNKRGDDMLVDFWAIAVFAIILLLFFILFSLNKTENENKVQAEFVNKDVNFMLTSFLRAPAIDVDPTKTVGEIITEDSTTGDFTRTKKLFFAYFPYVDELNGLKINSIALDVTGPNNGGAAMTKNQNTLRFFLVSWDAFWNQASPTTAINKYVADTYLPGYNSKIHVKLSLTEYILASEIQAKMEADKSRQNT